MRKMSQRFCAAGNARRREASEARQVQQAGPAVSRGPGRAENEAELSGNPQRDRNALRIRTLGRARRIAVRARD
jgi:hypothetical protein